MSLETIAHPDNLHCPSCSSRLLVDAAKLQPIGRPDPIHVMDAKTVRCRSGHDLPHDSSSLYRWRDENGFGAPTADD